MKVHTPRQIVDLIKEQTHPSIWSKDLRDWYVAEIIDLVHYNISQAISQERAEIIEEIKKYACDIVIPDPVPPYRVDYVNKQKLLTYLSNPELLPTNTKI